MSVLGKIFSSGATELVKGLGGALDGLTTSKEEKLEAKRKIKELVANYEIEMEKNITSRWEADLKSDSWLSKNVRPVVLIFLIVCTILVVIVKIHHQLEVCIYRLKILKIKKNIDWVIMVTL